MSRLITGLTIGLLGRLSSEQEGTRKGELTRGVLEWSTWKLFRTVGKEDPGGDQSFSYVLRAHRPKLGRNVN